MVFISILYLANDNYSYNEHYMLLMYQFIIMLSPMYNNFTFGPIEDIGWSNRGNRGHDFTVLICNLKKFFFFKFINDFLVII